MKTKEWMKLAGGILLAFLLAVPVFGAGKAPKEKVVTLFSVDIHCQGCVDKINKNIAFEKGITDMKIDPEKKTVEITYRKDKTNDTILIDAFRKIGKIATVIRSEVKGDKK